MWPNTFLLQETQFLTLHIEPVETTVSGHLVLGYRGRLNEAVSSEQCVPFIHGRTFKTEEQYPKGELKKEKEIKTAERVYIHLCFNGLWIPSSCLKLHRVRLGGEEGLRLTYKSILCSAEVEPGRSFIAEIPCTSSHLSWLMADTSGYQKIISVVCKFSINHEQDAFFFV